MKWRCRSAGFTILELLTVVVVAAIVAAVVVPTTGGLEAVRLTHAAHATKESLEHARSTAIATGRPAGARFDLTSGTISLVRVEPGSVGPLPLTDPMGTALEPIDLSTRYGTGVVSVTASEAIDDSIWFRFDGAPERRSVTGRLLGELVGNATIQLSKDGRSELLVVHGGTGLVEVATP